MKNRIKRLLEDKLIRVLNNYITNKEGGVIFRYDGDDEMLEEHFCNYGWTCSQSMGYFSEYPNNCVDLDNSIAWLTYDNCNSYETIDKLIEDFIEHLDDEEQENLMCHLEERL